MKPIIAITADELVDLPAGINAHTAFTASSQLTHAVEAAGGMPIILPYPLAIAAAEEQAAAMVAFFAGLIVPGGPDVDPTFYGEEPIPQIGRTAYQKDAFEIALVKAAAAAGKPILGICRGTQIYNVAMGGTLFQDLATQAPNYAIRHAQAAPARFPTHHVTFAPNGRLHALFGATGYVNSRHHQAVQTLAPGLKITATAADGVVEGLESVDDNQFLGVQWHPENLWAELPDQLRLFADLIARATRRTEH